MSAPGYDVRQAAMSMWDNVQVAQAAFKHYPVKRGEHKHDRWSIDTIRSWLMYGAEHPGRRRKTPVDVNAMVEKWVPIIKSLATAHDKKELDRCEFESEEHLMPLPSAPVRQLREFYAALVTALKADPTIPFFVWAMFESWGDVVLKHAPDADVRELKDQLAEEIATLVEKDVQPDLKTAIAGALRWRSPETLEKVKTAVKSGAKARMVGKESCLFLQVAGETVML